MKLLRLKLNSQFRSINPGFEVLFLRDFELAKIWDFAPYCLVGRNGSGKSNILEALAAIFYHIECIYLDYKPREFDGEGDTTRIHTGGFFPEKSYPDAFELEYMYYVRGSFSRKDFSPEFDTGYDAHILIEKKEGRSPVIKWLNRGEIEKGKSEELSRLEVKQFLPEYVIGYSSGENEILSLPFFKMRFIQYDEYLDRLKRDLDYSKPESRLVYLDDYFNQAILLSLYLMNDEEDRENDFLQPFRDEIGLEYLNHFRIIIRKHHLEPIDDELLQSLNEEDSKDPEKTNRELTSKINQSIEKLKQCCTSFYYDDSFESNQELFLDFFVEKEVKKAFRLVFGDALELFRTFQVLLNLNLYQVKPSLKHKIYRSTNIYLNKDVIPVPYDEDRIIRFKDVAFRKRSLKEPLYTKSLSDGEYQFLHSIGLCLLFRDTNSLFLLDEPETHLNPDWRAKYISTLRNCLSQENSKKDNRRDILITSHSPFIISDSHKEKVLFFEKGQLNPSRPNINTFGASVNLITIELFKRVDTIGDLASEKVLEFEKRIESDDDLEQLKDEIFESLGDSIERTILINQLIEKRKG
jgi:restriction system-associated AAA family ATPase